MKSYLTIFDITYLLKWNLNHHLYTRAALHSVILNTDNIWGLTIFGV